MDFFLKFLQNIQSIIISLITAGLTSYLFDKNVIEKKYKAKNNRIKIVRITVLAFFIFIILSLALHYFFFKKEPTGEQLIGKYRKQIQDIRIEFESIYRFYPSFDDGHRSKLFSIREKAPTIAEKLRIIANDKIDIGYKIAKYDYMSYILAIAAEIEIDMRTENENVQYTEKLISDGKIATNTCIHFINEATKNAEGGGEYDQAIYSWLLEDKTKDRVYSVLAWLTALEARLDNNITHTESETITKILQNVSPVYRSLYPLKENPSFKSVFEIN